MWARIPDPRRSDVDPCGDRIQINNADISKRYADATCTPIRQSNNKCPQSFEDDAEDKLVDDIGGRVSRKKRVADNLLCHRSNRTPNNAKRHAKY